MSFSGEDGNGSNGLLYSIVHQDGANVNAHLKKLVYRTAGKNQHADAFQPSVALPNVAEMKKLT